MSNSNETVEQPTPAKFDPTTPPKCPHCGQLLAGIGIWVWQVERAIISCIYCTLCGKAMHFTPIPLINPGVQPDPPRIARPS